MNRIRINDIKYYTAGEGQRQIFHSTKGGAHFNAKKGYQKLISNKRATCLLDIVSQITAKAMANRMMNVLHKIFAMDQIGSIRGRYIGTSLRTVDDVIQ